MKKSVHPNGRITYIIYTPWILRILRGPCECKHTRVKRTCHTHLKVIIMEKPSAVPLRAGVGRTDITPPPDCFLEGFAGRDHLAEGIHDRLKATALSLSAHNRQTVIVSLDIIDLPDNLVDVIWKKVKTHYHLEPCQILLNCSHTHAGPMTWPRIHTEETPDRKKVYPDEKYIQHLVENIVTAIGKALGDLRPARASWGMGETRIGICRRARDVSVYRRRPSGRHGIYANYPNPDREVDRACPVISLADEQDRPIALVFGASCHPTTMSHDNYLVSAEYPGVARRILEEQYGVPALFLQGIGGDVKPRRVAGETAFRSGSYEDVEAVGAELAEDVAKTVEKGLAPLDISIRCALKRFPVPLATGWDETAWKGYTTEDHPLHRRIWGEWWLRKKRAGEPVPNTLSMTISILELSPDIRFATLSGEVLTDMGLKVKRSFQSGTTLVLGYSNGRSTYIPDSAALREGGYEAIESVFFTPTMPAPWREDIDDTILAAFCDLEGHLD